jgi:hypothetical protein
LHEAAVGLRATNLICLELHMQAPGTFFAVLNGSPVLPMAVPEQLLGRGK